MSRLVRQAERARVDRLAVRAAAEHAEAFSTIEEADLSPLLERIGDARRVLIGEATHGTSEFYDMRARITRELVNRKEFSTVGLEGDWPDVSTLDRRVRDRPKAPPLREPPFSRFPTWMWRNEEMERFIEDLREWNLTRAADERAGLYELDLYSLSNSIGVVVDYLEERDPAAAEEARALYSCFSPWERDPARYGRDAATGRMRVCASECVRVLKDLLDERLAALGVDGEQLFDAERNGELVRDAEAYYRSMYDGAASSWNLRDRHMFRTLLAVMERRGAGSKAVVWAHNSHVGNATAMGDSGEINIGSLARRAFGGGAYLIGFGTNCGEAAAADHLDDATRIKRVSPSIAGSHERPCHEAGLSRFLLPLRQSQDVFIQHSSPSDWSGRSA